MNVYTMMDKTDPRSNVFGFLILLVVLLVVGAGATIGFVSQKNSIQNNNNGASQTTNSTGTTVTHSLPQKSIVFGVWKQSESQIKSYNITGNQTYLVANLPSAIKEIHVLSPTELLFINNTDSFDHGKSITIYSLKDKSAKSIIKAADGFGIDNYVVSDNGKYLATWEVQFAHNQQVLTGGKSRVYGMLLTNPSVKYLLYDEVVSNPVHYARAITNSGKVLLDSFKPNIGAGWAFGMSVSDIDGIHKTDITSMQDNSYGTQPVLLPDQTHLLFAGYDGKTISVASDGFRQALVSPNTIELLDINTFERKKLANISDTASYPNVKFDKETSTVIYTAIQNNAVNTYSYNLAKQQSTKLDTKNSTLIDSLSQKTLLIGTEDTSQSTLGNLGNEYAQPLTQLLAISTSSNNPTVLHISDSLIQYITSVSDTFFPINLLTIQSNNTRSLQLETFDIKPELQQTRQTQQSDSSPVTPQNTPSGKSITPTCNDLAIERCGAPLTLPFGGHYTQKQLACIQSPAIGGHKECFDSPLYIYGKKGESVTVSVNTPNNFSSQPVIATLDKNGGMFINKKYFASLSYSYTPAVEKQPPKEGVIVSRVKLEADITGIATKLGLNESEVTDLIHYVKNNLTAPYIFISFYNQEISKQILPLTFSPQPDTYINYVFYFKQYQSKPNFTPFEITFPKLQRRTPFTAVEISEVIE